MNRAPAGCQGVIFTPWLHGNRSPFEDTKARGIFFNIGLETGKTILIRSVVEGICFHLRWMLEAQERKVKTSSVITCAGGGAISPVICQILADITGREIVVGNDPQNAGALGAAIVIAVGMNIVSGFTAAQKLLPPPKHYIPNTANRAVYDRNYQVFKSLYKDNRKSFAQLQNSQNQNEFKGVGKPIGLNS